MTRHRATCEDCPWSYSDEDLVDVSDEMERHARKEMHDVDLERAVATDGGVDQSSNGTDRIPLYALAAHAAGDFPLQSDWMAANKFDSRKARAVHVAAYTAAFIPVAIASGWTNRQSVAFLGTLATTHFAIDSRRWNENVPIWFDQALHIVSLALSFALADRQQDTGSDRDRAQLTTTGWVVYAGVCTLILGTAFVIGVML